MTAPQLPGWVYDVVVELARWADEHPKLYAYHAGDIVAQQVDNCGCAALAKVPDDVRREAEVIRRYLADRATQEAP